MTFLAMREGRDNVQRSDFVGWADKYVRFSGKEQLTGMDLYGARCAMLHNYGLRSKLSREGQCRVILWMDRSRPPIKSHPTLPNYVLVAITGLRDAVFAGMDRFFIEICSDRLSKKAKLVEERLKTLVQQMPADTVMRSGDSTSTEYGSR
jgi:hypothetical protein